MNDTIVNKQAIIKAILEWNPWFEGDFPEKLLGFERELDVLQYLDSKEIKILEGPRRSGKSTLLFRVIHKVLRSNKNILYLNFDDEVLKKYSLREIYEVFSEKRDVEYLFVDEVQNCKEWSHFIRQLYDLQKVRQIWLTGSNSELIKQEYASLLTGRSLNISVTTLSFREFLSFDHISYSDLLSSDKQIAIKRAFATYLQYGAFPEVALRTVRRKELLINYHNDFLYKDIVARYGVNADKIRELSLFVHSNNSKKISYRTIAKALDLHQDSVRDYISYLSEIFLFSKIYHFSYSVKKQLQGQKKMYSLDTGLSNAVAFKFSQDYGRQLETVVYHELCRFAQDIYYFTGKGECDFVVKEGDVVVQLVQVTQLLNDDNRTREVDGLLEAMSACNDATGIILTEDQEEEFYQDDKKITVMPVWKWLLDISK